MHNIKNLSKRLRTASFVSVLGLGMIAGATVANAVTFNVSGALNNPNNTATVDFSYNASLEKIDISITNTGSFGADPRITGFAFNAPGVVASVSTFSAAGTANNGNWSSFFGANSINTPGNFGSFDIGAGTGSNLNGGSPNSGIVVGTTGVFSFDLAGLGLSALSEASFLSLLMSPNGNAVGQSFAVRFQRTGSGNGSDIALRDDGPIIITPPSAVPVPAALPLFGTGLAIMGFVGWRRKLKTSA